LVNKKSDHKIQWLSKINTLLSCCSRVGKDRTGQGDWIISWFLGVVLLAWKQKHHIKVSRWLLQPLFTQHLLFGDKECVLSTADNFYDLSCTNKW